MHTMEEKTREERLKELAETIFDETYFSVFTDEDSFYKAADYLEQNDIPVSELDKEIKKLHDKYKVSRPNAQDNLFDIIGDEFSRSEIPKARKRFNFDSKKELSDRAEVAKEAKRAEAEAEAEKRKDEQVTEQPDQNVFNADDPQAAAVDQQLAAAQSNPFLAGTEAERAQIANLLDIGNGKVALPDRSDNRSVARFNNAVKSKEFVLNAAKRKARDLQARGEQHRNLVNSEGMQDVMQKWIDSNASHAMAKKGLDNWTDRDKIAFFKNYKMGNFDAPEPQKIPIFDENGLVGYQSEKAIKSRLGEGKTFGVDPNKPNRVQRMERRNNQMLDEIRDEIKQTGKHPFGEGPVLGTDYAREVALRDTFDGGDIGALKKSARDFRDGAVPGRNYAEEVSPTNFDEPRPMPSNYSAPKESFEPKQGMVSQGMLAKNNEEVNSVLDSVSLPGPRNPVKTLPFSLDNPTDNSNGEKAQRRANADKAYADWQSRYGEGVRERKAFMDQRMQDRQQEIDDDILAKAQRRSNADKAYADWQSRYGEKARERKAFMDQRMQDREQELKRRQQASPFYNKNIFG